MSFTRKTARTVWTSVGYAAAKRGACFEAIKVSGPAIANEWIKQGMANYLRRVTRLGGHRANSPITRQEEVKP